jgi:hypothetical protein
MGRATRSTRLPAQHPDGGMHERLPAAQASWPAATGSSGAEPATPASWLAVGGQRGAAAAHTVPTHPMLPAWATRQRPRELGTLDVVARDGRAAGIVVKGCDGVVDADTVVLALGPCCVGSWRRRPTGGARERSRSGMPWSPSLWQAEASAEGVGSQPARE